MRETVVSDQWPAPYNRRFGLVEVLGFPTLWSPHQKRFRTSAGRFSKFTLWCRDVDLDLRSDQTHMVSFFTLGNGRGVLAPTIGYTSCECQQNLATERRFGGLKRVLLYPPRRFSSSICHSGSVIGICSGASKPASLRQRIKGCSRLG